MDNQKRKKNSTIIAVCLSQYSQNLGYKNQEEDMTSWTHFQHSKTFFLNIQNPNLLFEKKNYYIPVQVL